MRWLNYGYFPDYNKVPIYVFYFKREGTAQRFTCKRTLHSTLRADKEYFSLHHDSHTSLIRIPEEYVN